MILVAALALAGVAPQLKDRSRFCVQPDGKTWKLQDSPPLVDLNVHQVWEQAIYTAKWLSRVRIRRFEPDYEFDVEYRFDEGGKLSGMTGTMWRWGRWIAATRLYPLPGGGFEKPQVSFSRSLGGTTIVEPEDAEIYTPKFTTAEVFRTTQEIPCAVLLGNAEKMNATQK